MKKLNITDAFLLKLIGSGISDSAPYHGPHPREIDQLVPVVFYGRSGTVFFMSLLDGHPDLLSVGGCEFRSFFNFFDEQAGAAAETQLSWTLRTYGLDLEYPGKDTVSYVGTTHVPADIPFQLTESAANESAVGPPVSLFIARFLRLTLAFFGDPAAVRLSARDFFVLFHIAYNECLGRPVGKHVRTIVWAMHVPSFGIAQKVHENFSSGQFIHVVRRPTQSLGSHFKHYFSPKVPIPDDIGKERLAVHVLKNLLTADAPLAAAGFTEKAIRLEDIHGNPEATLQRLCTALSIGWNPRLLESTFFGKPYGMDTNNGRVAGFTTAHLQNQHTDILPPRDMKFLENLLFENYRQWNYEPLAEQVPAEERYAYLTDACATPLEIEKLSWKLAAEVGVPEAKVAVANMSARNLFQQRIAYDLEATRSGAWKMFPLI